MQDDGTGIEGTGFADIIKKRLEALREWLKPNPSDALPVTLIKSFFKGIALLVLVAFSPVIMVVLLLVFFAAF